jgi:hypothetical protein
MAEWSKALESGFYGNLSSPKGRGFEPHFCHTELPFSVVAVGFVQLPFLAEQSVQNNISKASRKHSAPCHSNELGRNVEKQESNAILYRSRVHLGRHQKEWNIVSVCRAENLVMKPMGPSCACGK